MWLRPGTVAHSRNVSGVDDFSFAGLRCKSWGKPERSEVGDSSCVTSVDLVTLLPGVWLTGLSITLLLL